MHPTSATIPVKNATPTLNLLSSVLFRDSAAENFPAFDLASIDKHDLRALAHSNHVVIRAFPAVRQLAISQNNGELADWIARELDQEHARIRHALSFLSPICEALSSAGKVVVMKSLDHWPDLGSDLDLFTNAEAEEVSAIMKRTFQAEVAERSWGDRLANKWNFNIPGLPEPVEVHVKRLGQTGEQISVAKSVLGRARSVQLETYTFQTTAPEDRLIISTLQRMYRHFYIRLCDVLDNALLAESGAFDYEYLQSLASSAGLWDGVATYLRIISEYVQRFRGTAVPLPREVTSGARFGADKIFFRRNFLRVPLLPQSANLYASELARLCRNGEIANTLRLSLLPGLATAAALEMKLTGSDKGIW